MKAEKHNHSRAQKASQTQNSAELTCVIACTKAQKKHPKITSNTQAIFKTKDSKNEKHLQLCAPSSIILRLGLVAQSVEQRIENPCVGGSIPPRATKKYVLKNKGLQRCKPLFFGRLTLQLCSIQPSRGNIACKLLVFWARTRMPNKSALPLVVRVELQNHFVVLPTVKNSDNRYLSRFHLEGDHSAFLIVGNAQARTHIVTARTAKWEILQISQ